MKLRYRQLVGAVAGAAGHIGGWYVRYRPARSLPGIVGALAVSKGLGEVYRPLFLIAIGLFLLALDRRVG